MRIVDHIAPGKKNAVTARELAVKMGIKDTRSISLMVERERKEGAPICASCSGDSPGYYLASGPDELESYIRSLDRRLNNIRESRERLGDTLAEMTGQQRIEVVS